MDPSDNLRSKIEALLFAAGRPIGIRQLAKLAESTPKAIAKVLDALEEDYREHRRGIALIQKDNKVQMVSNPEHGESVETFIKEEFTGPLSRAALETLAIIAYRGPIPKPEIDTVRGVNSAIMLRTLLVRGLVERKKNPKDARSFVYSLSFDFMRHLGIDKVNALPKFDELHNHEVMVKFAEGATDASIEKTK